MTLEEVTGKLTVLATSPCHCNVCKHAAKLAHDALMHVSPLGDEVMRAANTIPLTNEFRDLEERFRYEELHRLTEMLVYIGRGRCMMLTPTKVEHTEAPAPPQIPSLPYDQGMRDAAERYRKFTDRPNFDYPNKPRVPGSYWIKPRQRE
jgi:hypothetical protein